MDLHHAYNANTFIAKGLHNRASTLFQLFNNVPRMPLTSTTSLGCAPYALLIHSRSASSIRVCQPFPSARK